MTPGGKARVAAVAAALCRSNKGKWRRAAQSQSDIRHIPKRIVPFKMILSDLRVLLSSLGAVVKG